MKKFRECHNDRSQSDTDRKSERKDNPKLEHITKQLVK